MDRVRECKGLKSRTTGRSAVKLSSDMLKLLCPWLAAAVITCQPALQEGGGTWKTYSQLKSYWLMSTARGAIFL